MTEIAKHRVLKVLSRHIGKASGVCAEHLVIACANRAAEPRDLRRLRKLIQELRMEGYHVCAHPSTGYFMAANADELDYTCVFLYDRAMSSLQQISRMKKVSLPDLKGQLRLPT